MPTVVVSAAAPVGVAKPKPHVQFDTESLKLDLASVFSQRTKDLEEEEKAMLLKHKAKQSPVETRSKSWRNPDRMRKEIVEEEPVELKNQNQDTRKAKRNVFGTKTARQASWTSRKKSKSPRAEQPRQHSYSPRYLEFLHQSPNQSPRDNDHRAAEAIVKKKPVWG